ncbi:transcriptional regulator, partial (plasmid) [Enterococcus faecalis]
MKRKSYDRWGIEITSFNRNIAFYVECDCGELAKSVFQKNY